MRMLFTPVALLIVLLLGLVLLLLGHLDRPAEPRPVTMAPARARRRAPHREEAEE